MKHIKYLFLVLCTFFVFEMISFNKAEAEACLVTADVIKKASTGADDSIREGCDTLPDNYEIRIYKLYLCKSAPTEPTTSSTAVLPPTSCSQFFNSASGALTSVTQGSEIDLDGTYTRPPNGTYTHGYAYMDNTFGITWSGEIASSMAGSPTGGGGTSGVYCATVAGSGTHAAGSTHTNSSKCDTSAVTAGKFVETLRQFGSSSNAFTSRATATNINGTTASIVGILVDGNEHKAANTGEVVKLEGLVAFADPVIVTTKTNSLSMSFNVGEGMHLNGNTVLQIGGGPFQAIMKAN